MCYLSFSETLNNPAKQLLFFPLSQRIRIKAQVFAGGILGPLGQGTAGVLLIILVNIFDKISYYSIFIFILSGLSILLIFVLKPFYKNVLNDSLQKKQLNPSDLAKILSSPGSEEVIKEILKDNNEQVILFTMHALEKIEDISDYLPLISELVFSDNEQIAAQSIILIRERGDNSYLPVILSAMNNKSALVASEAIIAYCKLKKELALEKINPFLNSNREEIRLAVMVGLAQYSGFYGNLIIFPHLNGLLNSIKENQRLEATKVIGKIGGFGSGVLIKKLLNDTSDLVKKEAIQSSWIVRDPILIPELVQNLQVDSLKDFTIKAIQSMPLEAVSNIEIEILKDKIPFTDKLILIQCLAFIGGQESVVLLLKILNSHFDAVTLLEASKSLSEIVNNHHYAVTRESLILVEEYIQQNIIISRKARLELGKGNEFLASLFYDHAVQNLKILANLLAIYYSGKEIKSIQLQLFGNSESLTANAIELLEITIPKKDASKYIRYYNLLLEKEIPEGKGFSEETSKKIFASSNEWLKNIAAYINLPEEDVMKQKENQIDYYEIISRISFLKKVNLFADLPADYLASIVPLLKEKTFYKDEILFSQGEVGDAFYLIKSGSISVIANGIEVATLGIGEGIGEMALIEGETRSATALLKEDSQLFKLSSSDFNKLLNSYSSITISLLRTLSQRLRIRAAKSN